MSELTKRDYGYFECAKKVAKLSNYNQFHLGCVLVYKGSIIGRGRNGKKSHPIQKKYNRKYREFRDTHTCIIDSIHAEISALSSVDNQFDDWGKVKAYIFRISPGKQSGHGMARPCPACMNALKDVGIRDIYYTTNDGYCYERIGV